MEDLDESQSSLTALQVSDVAYPNDRDIWMLFEQPSMSYKGRTFLHTNEAF